MEVCYQVEGRKLDLILHSPGGSPEAAEQMLEYLRTQFDYIRAIVPLQAKSAATMIALGCDEILMGEHSELGPIDPQILVPVPEGRRFAPAHAILRDFKRAKDECKTDVGNLGAGLFLGRHHVAAQSVVRLVRRTGELHAIAFERGLQLGDQLLVDCVRRADNVGSQSGIAASTCSDV